MTKWGITNPILVQWIVRMHHRRPRRMIPSLLPSRKKVLIWIVLLTHGMKSRVKLARHSQTMPIRKSSQIMNHQAAKSPSIQYSTIKTTSNRTGTIMAAYGLRIWSNPSMLSDWDFPRTVLLRLTRFHARLKGCLQAFQIAAPCKPGQHEWQTSRPASALLPSCRA